MNNRKHAQLSARCVKKNPFRSLRLQCLHYWLKHSKRKRNFSTGDDNRAGAMDCEWHGLSPENVHCNFFCGVGEWVSGVTDVLTDTSCDKLSFDSELHKPRLYRQYLRLIFIVNEVIEDLEHGLKVCGKSDNQTNNRNFLSPNADKFVCFTNHVLKHKAKTFHANNNHLPILFADFKVSIPADAMSISNKPDVPSCIAIPKLQCLIDMVLVAYKNFDGYIREAGQEERIAKLNAKFGGMNLTESESE